MSDNDNDVDWGGLFAIFFLIALPIVLLFLPISRRAKVTGLIAYFVTMFLCVNAVTYAHNVQYPYKDPYFCAFQPETWLSH